MSSQAVNSNSSLRPGWFKGSGSGGGKGFQPPPTASDRGEKGRSASIGSSGSNNDNQRDSNKFAALLDDDDVVVENGGADTSPTASSSKPSSNSRSEAFRSSFNRSASTGTKPPGRSLADLAAKVPESAPTGRRHSSFGEGTRPGPGRLSMLRVPDPVVSSGGTIDAYKPDPKVIRYTREKLLSLRPAPSSPDPGPPDILKPLDGSVILSSTAQDPVCWDTFDGESIWETARERRPSAPVPKGALDSVETRRRIAPNIGRWSRGLALPPQEEARRREREADNPNELWDDPMGGATGAAADFSAFGAMPIDDDENAFDFDKMAEASQKLEEEIHGSNHEEDQTDLQISKKVDLSRPLASAGTTLVSGSGDDVNVFEDFDSPSEPIPVEEALDEPQELTGDAAAVRGGEEDPSASSRLMKMIGVTKESDDVQPREVSNNPWGGSSIPNTPESSVDPIIGGIGGGSLSSNPWGDLVAASAGTQSGGLGLSLSTFGTETKNREAQLAAEREKLALQEAELLQRRREEARRRAIAEARQQPASMQQSSQQSQIELVLMERICAILENSWGRSDLVSILTTLHSEDSRVIPLLANVDSLCALIARSPQRVALRRDPSFGGDIAVLRMTNTQWQKQQQEQQQRAQMQQEEEIRRRRQLEEEKSRAEAQIRMIASINHDAPWFYSDPQNNIQGPFRGDEMRQWLEAGYFKGDLPISQLASGPFHPLSVWFPDLHHAFQRRLTNGNDLSHAAAVEKARVEAAEKERFRKEAEEQERRAAEEARRAARREVEEREAAAREAERRRHQDAAKASEAQATGIVNDSSNQLKMLLGLSGAGPIGNDESERVEANVKAKHIEKKGKATNNKAPQKYVQDFEFPATAPAPAIPASAWGGAANAIQSRKSMSEIQQEEARAAAMLAAKRGSMPQTGSGWANVAAGTSGWSSGAILQATAAQNSMTIAGARPSQTRPGSQPAVVQGGASRKVAPVTLQQRSNSTASSTPAEEFGTSMSPAMEKWCKEKMIGINGSDDLTLIAFCMTLNDTKEIRQYLTTYLGNTPQVNSFASEFINKRGLGSKQEEWETPGSAKKGRKKKTGR